MSGSRPYVKTEKVELLMPPLPAGQLAVARSLHERVRRQVQKDLDVGSRTLTWAAMSLEHAHRFHVWLPGTPGNPMRGAERLSADALGPASRVHVRIEGRKKPPIRCEIYPSVRET